MFGGQESFSQNSSMRIPNPHPLGMPPPPPPPPSSHSPMMTSMPSTSTPSSITPSRYGAGGVGGAAAAAAGGGSGRYVRDRPWRTNGAAAGGVAARGGMERGRSVGARAASPWGDDAIHAPNAGRGGSGHCNDSSSRDKRAAAAHSSFPSYRDRSTSPTPLDIRSAAIYSVASPSSSVPPPTASSGLSSTLSSSAPTASALPRGGGKGGGGKGKCLVASAEDGWRMMPHLFDTWDADNSGSINRYELTVGMTRMIKERNLRITVGDVYRIMAEVDLNDDRQLDRREFGCFVSRVAAAAGVTLDGVTEGLLRQQQDEAERRLDKVRQSQNLDLAHEGWKMMPHLFDTWDVDNSGCIDKYELTSGMARVIQEEGLRITVGEVVDIMKDVDTNNNRTLDRREFGALLNRVADRANITFDGLAFLLMKQREAEARKRLERLQNENKSNERAWIDIPRLFKAWDDDDDGYVSREEVAMAVNNLIRRSEITKISLAECLCLMDEVDMNGDRVLNQMEFGAFMARLALASGVLLEALVGYFMQDCKARKEGKGNGRFQTGRFGNFFARMRVSMAEEEMVEPPVR